MSEEKSAEEWREIKREFLRSDLAERVGAEIAECLMELINVVESKREE